LRCSLKADRLHVVYNGVAAATRRMIEKHSKIRRIGVVGRIEEEKGQLEFVHAARILSGTRSELRFSVIGKPLFEGVGYFDRVRAASEGLPVEFTGWMDNLAEIFDCIDLLVVPSSSLDATPRIILEALAAGIPIVAYAVGGIPEILRNLETGILVDQRTPEALAKGISSALEMSQESIRSLVENGSRVWREKHSSDAYGNKICRVISQMLEAA